MYAVHGQGFGDLGSGAGAAFAVLGKQAAGAAIDIAAGAASSAIETKILGDYQKRLSNMEAAKTRTQAELAERYAQLTSEMQQAQSQQEHLQNKEMLELQAKLARESLAQQYDVLYGPAPATPAPVTAPGGVDPTALMLLLQAEEKKKDRRKKALWWGLGGAGVGILVVGGTIAYALTRD